MDFVDGLLHADNYLIRAAPFPARGEPVFAIVQILAGKSFDAAIALGHRMVRIADDGHNFVALHLNLQAAEGRAIAAVGPVKSQLAAPQALTAKWARMAPMTAWLCAKSINPFAFTRSSAAARSNRAVMVTWQRSGHSASISVVAR
jgi:hypothetical protein